MGTRNSVIWNLTQVNPVGITPSINTTSSGASIIHVYLKTCRAQSGLTDRRGLERHLSQGLIKWRVGSLGKSANWDCEFGASVGWPGRFSTKTWSENGDTLACLEVGKHSVRGGCRADIKGRELARRGPSGHRDLPDIGERAETGARVRSGGPEPRTEADSGMSMRTGRSSRSDHSPGRLRAQPEGYLRGRSPAHYGISGCRGGIPLRGPIGPGHGVPECRAQPRPFWPGRAVTLHPPRPGRQKPCGR